MPEQHKGTKVQRLWHGFAGRHYLAAPLLIDVLGFGKDEQPFVKFEHGYLLPFGHQVQVVEQPAAVQLGQQGGHFARRQMWINFSCMVCTGLCRDSFSSLRIRRFITLRCFGLRAVYGSGQSCYSCTGLKKRARHVLALAGEYFSGRSAEIVNYTIFAL